MHHATLAQHCEKVLTGAPVAEQLGIWTPQKWQALTFLPTSWPELRQAAEARPRGASATPRPCGKPARRMDRISEQIRKRHGGADIGTPASENCASPRRQLQQSGAA